MFNYFYLIRAIRDINSLLRQKEEIDEFLKLPVKGRAWYAFFPLCSFTCRYVIDFQWWNKWCTYIESATGGDSLDVASDDYPGEVDNTSLLGKLPS